MRPDIRATVPCVVVRHGSAGERATWHGDDRERHLDELGHRQALGLIDVLEAFGVRRVLSADVLRCLDTVGPFAAARRITIESEPLLSESGFAAAPDSAVERLLAVVTQGEPVAVCSQGRSIPPLVRRVCEELGGPTWDDTVPKGGFVALHLDVERAGELVAVDHYPPVA